MKYIHVNLPRIRTNPHRPPEERQPVITVKPTRYSTGPYGNTVEIRDQAGNRVALVKYRPEAPLNCGAQAYIECLYEAEVIPDE
jgi:hypothetical protein